MELLERAEQVATVVDRYAQVDRHGQLVLISGEAGAGKSALVQDLLDHHLSGARVLVGRCDDLFAPRPLGPLADIARQHPGPLGDALAAGDQPAIFDAALVELAAQPSPTVLVLEDLQWADEATLDLVRFVGRRLDGLPALVLVTHRDDIAQDHPVRRAIGGLVGSHVTRVHVPPLSVDAVHTLVGDRPLDVTKLHAATGGNPFFLIETLDAAPGSLPVTVRDVVLARAAPLSGPARDALDAAAVLGRHAQASLVQAAADCEPSAIDECIHAGLLVDDDGLQAFRHDLVRQAVEDSMTPLRRRQLHARALDALGEDGDVVQRAHHAIGAGDDDAILQLAWRAADQCVALGAWTEASLLYGQALEHSSALPDGDLGELLQATATVSLRVELIEPALAAAERYYALLEPTGDTEALARWECEMSRVYRGAGRGDDSTLMSERAAERALSLGDSPVLAQALSNLAGQQLVLGRYEECLDTSQRALALGERFDLEEVCIDALNSYGSALGSMGRAGGEPPLRESLDRAKRANLPNHVARAAGNLGEVSTVRCNPSLAVSVLDEGVAYAEENELRFRLNCLRPSRAQAFLFLGQWDKAEAELDDVLVDPYVSPINRAIVLSYLGQLRTRRGDPGAVATLEDALAIAEPLDEAQLIVPIHHYRAEAAWLAGDTPTAIAHVEAARAYEAYFDTFHTREMALMARRTGVDWTPTGAIDEPTELILAGDWSGLAAFWTARHCPYEAADAGVESDQVEEVQRAYEQLMALGARPRANHAAKKLRELGARVARGPRASTQANAAGLTTRELEVAALLAEGLTNTEIADRLIVSQKTVDHHVSAVLTKLGVSSRREVSRAAAAMGVDLSSRVSS